MDTQQAFSTPTPRSSKSASLTKHSPLCIDLTLESPSEQNNVDDDDVMVIKTLTNLVVKNTEELTDAEISDDTLEKDTDFNDIFVADDNDLDKLRQIDPKKMKCHRCPIDKQGFWKDQRKFLVHIKRHVLTDHFGCIVCGKPFIKLGQCLKHERYCGKTASDSELYDLGNNLQKSTTLYPYRGPQVSSILESYAVQLSRNVTRKASKLNAVAKFAVKKHKKNVKLKRAENMLDKFPKRPNWENGKYPVKRFTRKSIIQLENVPNENTADMEANIA